MFSRSSAGNAPANIAGMIAKYLATSFAIENVVSEPRVISSCLPISTISMSFVGFESRSTMFPASLAACVPVFIATPTSACGERGRVVRPVAGHRDELAARLLAPDQRHLVLGRRLGQEVVDAGLVGDRRRGERVVAGDHDRADAHRAQLGEPLLHALLDDVLEVDRRRALVASVGDDQRRAAGARDLVDDRLELSAERCRRRSSTQRRIASAAPLRIVRAVRGRRRSSASRAVNGMSVRCARALARGGRSAPSRARRSSAPRASRRRGSTAAPRRRARARRPRGAAGTRLPGGCRA